MIQAIYILLAIIVCGAVLVGAYCIGYNDGRIEELHRENMRWLDRISAEWKAERHG